MSTVRQTLLQVGIGIAAFTTTVLTILVHAAANGGAPFA